ncbi:NYN domain-containing protein [Arthrobacter sp. AFG20]|uniref:NYN domain-containing protein n=1 Tax=Arthrobacter sp. AFG20 TaxID=1688671 RepID=UPI000C9DF9F7|nr:NYN domain-containing protein [Arthrobacter sp. AFG20]PNH79222.1 hypothetical protein CXZ05_20730 [Arthrobacter sp. AFG20]
MLGYDRSVHLLDIENLLSAGEIEANAINAVFADYKKQVTVTKEDLVIIGVSSVEGLMAVAMSNLRNCRLLYRPGKDGADLALQEVLDHEQLESRFEVVHVATGDGGFSASVAALAGRGAYVVVISLPESLSMRLRLAAHQTIELRTEAIERDAA